MMMENLQDYSRIGANEDKIVFPTKLEAKLAKGTAIESVSKVGRPITIVAEVMATTEKSK